MLQLATLKMLFFVLVTTVRTVTMLMLWVKQANKGKKGVKNKGTKGWKRGKGVGHGPLYFLAKCPTAHEEDAKLVAVSSIAVFTQCVESRREGNAHGFSTSWVSGVVVVCLYFIYLFILGTSCPRPGSIVHGKWTCEKQQIPIPDTFDLNGNLETYPGSTSIY